MSGAHPDAAGGRELSLAPQRPSLAPTPAAAGRVASRRRALPSGMWGMALFLGAESMLFAGLISSYFYLDFRATRWPPAGARLPETLIPSILTAVLVTTSVPVALAARRAIAGRRAATMALLGLAAFVQSGYLAYQLHDLVDQVHSLPPQGSAYASAYIALLGLHHAHVLLGVLLDLGMLFWLALSGLSDYRVTGVRCVALYWHVVNVIAVAVLLTELTPVL
ncbi:MAG TPA: cytochrome c oxidase subunit 3 [Solirubrobacteraceae bacterium]|jgi:heme/copper-type cytochrome/quinol oxidase subunit 3|nr:cytochrome c oxidase subunit 3 [Solirubrobacteraceae bacterium]